ncbi:hypothetical protein Moror_11865 [Moniliophthora roreri MCA 2997]|uniref:Uncharacterized protein n=2 Tax=Moniliophthora roreri TaxID=221103 RepID=V2WK05_MONRO|nr:hypothetical protein Moror_11865 [Moniliophthora roreri MCA 2997]
MVIQGAYLILAFCEGTTDTSLPEESILHVYEQYVDGKFEVESTDWESYNVNIFVDHDMFIRYCGGGIGHPTREVTRFMEEDARTGDKPLLQYNPQTGELLSNDKEMGSYNDNEELDITDDSDNEDDSDDNKSIGSRCSVAADPEDYNDTDPETDNEL